MLYQIISIANISREKDNLQVTVLYINNGHSAIEEHISLAFSSDDFRRILEITGENEKEPIQIIIDDLEDIKYAIFHYLHMYHRRRNNKEELKSMIVLNRDKFKRYDSFGYLELLVFLHSLDDIKNFSYCIKFIQKAQLYKDNLKYAENHGYKALFAHIVADSFEQTQQNPDLYKGLIQEAKDAIEDAIALSDGFAKYYFIAGKLNALCLDFDEAKKLVLKAIYMEDSFQIDYAVRVAPYSAELIKIEAKQGLQDANKSLNEPRKKNNVTNARLNNSIELIALFAAVISLTFGGFQLVNESTIFEACILLATLSSCIIVIFSLLHNLLHYEYENSKEFTENKIRNIIRWLIPALGIVIVLILLLISYNFV